jgi:hypothetical protein
MMCSGTVTVRHVVLTLDRLRVKCEAQPQLGCLILLYECSCSLSNCPMLLVCTCYAVGRNHP